MYNYMYIPSRLKRKVLMPQPLTLLWGRRTNMAAHAANLISDVVVAQWMLSSMLVMLLKVVEI